MKKARAGEHERGPRCRRAGEDGALPDGGHQGRRGKSLRGLVQIRPQNFTGYAGNALHVADALGWDAVPLVNRLPRYAELTRKFSNAADLLGCDLNDFLCLRRPHGTRMPLLALHVKRHFTLHARATQCTISG